MGGRGPKIAADLTDAEIAGLPLRSDLDSIAAVNTTTNTGFVYGGPLWP